MKIYSIPREVADAVRSRCDRLAKDHPADDAFPVKLPPGDGLRDLLEEAFWASISRDEGRQCRFTVAYYGCDAKENPADLAVALQPKPFDRERLRRLAAVAFAADAEIAVSLVDGELRIIGLHKRFRLAAASIEIEGVPIERTIPIRIEVRGPAHIVVRYAIARILTYANGEIRKPGPNVLYMEGPFRSALDDLALSAGASSLSRLRSDLKSLLDHVDRHGHGGLLVLSATEPIGLESTSWPITNDVYSLSDVQSHRSESVQRLQLPKDDPNRVSFSEAVEQDRSLEALERDILKLSASLTLTDGGVWLDGSLRPRAFGLFAQLPLHPRLSTALDAAGTSLREKPFDTLGARHRAMVALASHNPGAPTIAMSVDGGFSAALRSKDRTDLLVWDFQSSDLEADDPFDPQSQAIWNDILRSTR